MTAMTAERADLVSERAWRGQQSLDAEVVVRSDRAWSDGALYRATVHRDSYDAQSHAHVHVWTETGWTLLLSRTIGELPGLASHSYVERDGWQVDAYAACYALLAVAAGMLGSQW